MRTIKFRGCEWNADNELLSFVYGKLCDADVIRTIKGVDKVVHYKTVGQFTGLIDMAGNEVYEGDLLSDTEQEPMILPVIYSDKYAIFCVDISYSKDGGSIEDIKTCYEGGFLVIGNIHENPSMIK